MGTFTLVQEKDGKKKSFPIQIRRGNVLAIFMHVYKDEHPQDPARPYVHQLMSFFCDERHIKNILKDCKKDLFKELFWGDIKNIKLNMYYKECNTLLKYMVRDGLKVQCYYEEPSK